MQNNYSLWMQFLKNYQNSNSILPTDFWQAIEAFIDMNEESIFTEKWYEVLSQIKEQLSTLPPTVNNWKMTANIERCKANFQCMHSSEMFLDIHGFDYYTGIAEIIHSVGLYESLCGVHLNNKLSDEHQILTHLNHFSMFVYEGNLSTFKELYKNSNFNVSFSIYECAWVISII